MNSKVKISVRGYSVTLRDTRTGETATESVVLTKEQVKAADDTGLTLSGLLEAVYARRGYRVVEISTPVKKELAVPLIFDGGKIRVDAHALMTSGLPRISGSELAKHAAVVGGEEARRYCEYLNAHGFEGDAFSDYENVRLNANASEMSQALLGWGYKTYRQYVTDSDDFSKFLCKPQVEECKEEPTV